MEKLKTVMPVHKWQNICSLPQNNVKLSENMHFVHEYSMADVFSTFLLAYLLISGHSARSEPCVYVSGGPCVLNFGHRWQHLYTHFVGSL